MESVQQESMESSVQVIESCLVAPREATPTKPLWLSPIDVVAANAGHTPLVFLYSSGGTFFDVPRLKAALAKALVAYYPLAGRLGVDDDGRVEICCTGEGALFVVARSRSLTAQDLDFFKPSPEMKTMFVPSIDPAAALIMATQVTFLKCGAVVLGLSIQHAAADGIAFSHFMQTWSALYISDGGGGDESTAVAAAAKEKDELPCHDRTLLRARSPPVVRLDAFYYPKGSSEATATVTTTLTEAFPISRDQLVTLKRLCRGASTFISMSALVWQCMTVVRRRRLPADAIMRISFPVNVKRLLRPPLPTRYFGNSLISLSATGAARDIASEALPSVAARIGAAIGMLDDELVRSAIDFVELACKNDTMPRRRDMPETELRIVSWLNMHLGLDLGCGGPQAITCADAIPHGFVGFADYGPADQRAVCVVVRMEAANINHFKHLLYASIADQKQASISKL